MTFLPIWLKEGLLRRISWYQVPVLCKIVVCLLENEYLLFSELLCFTIVR